jgi:ComF family protein
MRSLVNSAYSGLLEGLFPQHCALCGLQSSRDLPLCAGCEGDLQVNHHCCRRCALPLPLPLPEAASEPGTVLCGQCQQHPPPFNRVTAPWLYDEMLAYLIHRWKYRREHHLTDLFARLLLRSQPPPAVDLLVPVPLHWRRRWQRGFNQSELLCHRLVRLCPELANTPVDGRMLLRNRATAPQSGMDARQRAGNLQGAFTVRGPCDNLRLAVVDDVLTTGATATAVANALQTAGAVRVEIWCLARTPAPAG